LGYLLDFSKIKIPANLRRELKQKIGKGYSLLDPIKPRTKYYNREWMLILNVKKKDLIEWRRVY